MNVGALLGGLLKAALVAGLTVLATKLGDPTTFAGFGGFAFLAAAVGLAVSKFISDLIAKIAPPVAAFFGRV